MLPRGDMDGSGPSSGAWGWQPGGFGGLDQHSCPEPWVEGEAWRLIQRTVISRCLA